jgi:hypothetical protein
MCPVSSRRPNNPGALPLVPGSHLWLVSFSCLSDRLFCPGKCLFRPVPMLALLPENVQKGRLEDGTKNKVHFVTQFPGTNPPAGA